VEVAAEFEVAALGVVGADLALVLVEIEADAVRPVPAGCGAASRGFLGR
jgi:hypothetical protein